MYCTIADIRAYDSAITEAAYPDPVVDEAIALAVRVIDQKAGQWFESRDKTLSLTGNGINDLKLPVPAIEITSVTIDEEELDSEYYKIKKTADGVNRFLRHKLGVWPQDSEIEVEGRFGKVEEDESVPPEAKRLCMILAVKFLKDEADQPDFKSERFKDHSYTLQDGQALLYGSREAMRLLEILKAPPSMGVF